MMKKDKKEKPDEIETANVVNGHKIECHTAVNYTSQNVYHQMLFVIRSHLLFRMPFIIIIYSKDFYFSSSSSIFSFFSYS